jgi:hypothetical protein
MKIGRKNPLLICCDEPVTDRIKILKGGETNSIMHFQREKISTDESKAPKDNGGLKNENGRGLLHHA